MNESLARAASANKPKTRWFWGSLALMGIGLILYGGWRAVLIVRCVHWPTTTGTITRSELDRGMLREGVATPDAAITYEYRVDAVVYSGQRISYSRRWGPHTSANALLRRYRTGTPVKVFYDPIAPKRSVLDVTVSWRGFRMLLAGCALTPLGILGYRRRWPLQSERLMDGASGQDPLTRSQKALGALGLLAVVALAWLWWALIKLYAGVH